jgi:hypothetical protein
LPAQALEHLLFGIEDGRDDLAFGELTFAHGGHGNRSSGATRLGDAVLGAHASPRCHSAGVPRCF